MGGWGVCELCGGGTVQFIMFSLHAKVGQPPEILVSLGLDDHGQKLHGLVLKARNIHLPSSSGSKGKYIRINVFTGMTQLMPK